MPSTSIIMPCYNVEKFISRAIESVIEQSDSDFELLVVIDGSPDNSKTIAESYAIQDKRIKILEKVNGGLSDARNYGLKRARGEFIYFMDSDDWIEPQLLEDNINILRNEQLDFVIFGYIQDNENEKGKLISSRTIIPIISKITKGDQAIRLDSHHVGLMGYAWNKIYRRSFLLDNNLWFEKGTSLVEDILFNIPVFCSSNIIRWNSKPYYHYLNRQVTTLMKTFHENSYDLKKRRSLSLEKFFNDWNVESKNTLLASSHIQGVRYCIHNLFSFKNQLSFNEKVTYIKKMYDDDVTRQLIKSFQAKNIKSTLYKFLIANKMAFTSGVLAKLIK